ncbi:Ulp1 protease family, carboxy-terminal domain protein [Arachis hypogaea]|nr:Ulp1 protease family, carboxy-terminal domain protein [Arachis hypogaea]
MHFSALDEKLGKGVVEALSTMIREAVVDGITTVLPKFVETVGSSSKIESHSVKLSDIAPAVTPPSDSLKRFLDANPAMYLGDEPVTKKRTPRRKGKKPVSEVKKELHFGEKLSPGRSWLYYNNYNPNMDEDDMPHCLDLSFRPTKEMKFFEYELAIAAYIFGNNLDPKEVLIPDDHCMGTRETLLTIMPGKPIIGDIFVPIHLNDHWFLIVVNLLYGTVRYMDSFKRCTSMIERKRVIDDVLTYLEKFVSDKNFQETPSHKNLQFSKYKFSEPTVPQQKANSNDCGIWVAEWMILNHYWGVNKPWIVNDYSRMRLAVDLVYKWHNPKRDMIKELAVADWNKKMQQSVLQT